MSKAMRKTWLKAARSGSLDTMLCIAEDNPDIIAARGGDDGTAMHEVDQPPHPSKRKIPNAQAAREGHADVVQWLYEHGASTEVIVPTAHYQGARTRERVGRQDAGNY